MSIYYCEECDQYIDGDWNPPTEYKDGEICESCAEKLLDEDGNLIEDKDDG